MEQNFKRYSRYGMEKIVNYSRYKISEFGDIMSYCNHIPYLMTIKNRLNKDKIISLYDDQNKPKEFYIDHLVAKTFIPNLNNYKYVIHIDEDIGNNHYKNLMWSETSMNNNSEWKDIPKFPGYKISKNGTVKSYIKKSPYELKPYISEQGYLKVTLTNEISSAIILCIEL